MRPWQLSLTAPTLLSIEREPELSQALWGLSAPGGGSGQEGHADDGTDDDDDDDSDEER